MPPANHALMDYAIERSIIVELVNMNLQHNPSFNDVIEFVKLSLKKINEDLQLFVPGLGPVYYRASSRMAHVIMDASAEYLRTASEDLNEDEFEIYEHNDMEFTKISKLQAANILLSEVGFQPPRSRQECIEAVMTMIQAILGKTFIMLRNNKLLISYSILRRKFAYLSDYKVAQTDSSFCKKALNTCVDYLEEFGQREKILSENSYVDSEKPERTLPER